MRLASQKFVIILVSDEGDGVFMDYVSQFNKIINSFKIKAVCTNYSATDNYSYYDLKLLPGGKVRDLQKFGDEIALSLKMSGAPTVKILHDKGVVRVEFISPRKKALNLFEYFTNDNVPNGDLTCLLGQSTTGDRVWMDLAKNPHMIVSGTTGSGKSSLLHNIIANLLNYSNSFIFLIDPKNVEFSRYDCKMNRVSVSYTYAEAVWLMDGLIDIMETRYGYLRAGKNIDKLPYLVVIIDEFADLIIQDEDKSLYRKITKLAQKCRAAKISIILSTQRPSADVINGVIKANFPARIACKVSSHVDSKVILDKPGAENLLGKGDALIRDNSRFMDRFQVAYTTSEEVVKHFGV